MKGFKQGHLIALRPNWSGGRGKYLWWWGKWKPVSEILSDSSLNVGNANETWRRIQILYLFQKWSFPDLG